MEDDDTVDESIDDTVHAGPPRAVLALYRALAHTLSSWDLVEQAIANSDSAAVERFAFRAVYWWLVALAALRRLARSSERGQHVEPALRSVTDAASNLSQLSRVAARKVRSSRHTMVLLRLCLAASLTGTEAANRRAEP